MLIGGNTLQNGIKGNGVGATNVTRAYLTGRGRPESLIEETLLGEMNAIFVPDTEFTRILTLEDRRTGIWEVFLEEAGKGRYPLSETGSGIKTVFLVLLFLYLVPDLAKRNVGEYVFTFEELENNLHPALQRRLFLYLRDFAVKNGCPMFITTHSSVVIDLLSEDENTQILHVRQENGNATVEAVDSYLRQGAVLDDLGVRASDLLQANGIVWVEGPTDKLYFDKWVEFWSNGELRDGAHYQCVPYGGSLGANLNVEDPNQIPDQVPDDLINILHVNRNAILIADSDKSSQDAPVNPKRELLATEIAKVGGMSWITAGREVENYLPKEAIATLLKEPSETELGKFEDLKDYLNGQESGLGNRVDRNKVKYARKMLPALTKDRLLSKYDLAKRMEEACNQIRKWNAIE